MKDIPKLRVKEICKEKGMTLKQLSEVMGVTPESLTRSIAEDANPTLGTLIKIASCLSVKLDEMVVGTKPKNQIYGHIEVNGELYKIRNLADLEELCVRLQKIEE